MLLRGLPEIEAVSVCGLPRANPLIERQLDDASLRLQHESAPVRCRIVKVNTRSLGKAAKQLL